MRLDSRVLVALLALAARGQARAQGGGAPMIVGVVVDSVAGVGVAGAEVALEGTTARTVTDQRGQFRLVGTEAG
ncbi:MAG: hypothetical protein ACJ8AD_04475, partial [Gemmatimonadaceae bacterium]